MVDLIDLNDLIDLFNNELINEVILHSDNRNSEKLNKLIDDLHPADLADLLTFLNSEQRSFTLSVLDEETYTNVLAELDDTIIDETIQKLENKKVVKFLSKKIFNDIESQILIFFLFLPPTCLRFLVIFLYYKLILI